MQGSEVAEKKAAGDIFLQHLSELHFPERKGANMPGELIHQTITAQALQSCGITDAAALAERYCSYPDYYFDDRWKEVEPYMFFHEGIQFHYPPHTPVEEFYRYWNRDENGNYLMSTRKNDNIVHTEIGFRYYMEKVVALLRQNERDEAWKYLGCLLHFLEDSAFGLHALEGADGTDIFVLDRLSGSNVTRELCKIPLPEKCFSQTVEPQIFAGSVPEAVSLLYARCSRGTALSRQYLFDQAVQLLYGTGKCSVEENAQKMFFVALSLAADTIATLIAISENSVLTLESRKLTDFSPFHYPIGGAGGFGLRRFEENDNTVVFGTNSSALLLYSIPENIYSRFTAKVYGDDTDQLTLSVINNGVEFRSFEVEKNREYQIDITNPGGTVGFKITSSAVRGKIEIRDGVFCQ